ncbi:MAG TPA: hypothetical protein VGC18_12545 [Lacisediminihabitans sp.]|uniref:hypothetical protein n=1 Tax=Lacisediminihabitans sp. TaxID=2787631 RepID=UPI002EDB5EE0
MGFLDRLLGRDEPQRDEQRPRRDEDQLAVERYRYLLRTAPPETIEQVHTEAFSKLTPKQRDILFQQLTANAETPSERPADARPATLAQAATRAEIQQPGSLTRTLGGAGLGGPGLGGLFASSLLGSVAGYVIGSALVSAFMPMDNGGDAGTADGSDAGSDAGDQDGSGADTVDASADGADYGAADYDGGSDFGGSDFGGGGDFGGGDFF